MTLILAVSGKKQSGKDTLLKNLRPYLDQIGEVKYYTFADELKNFLITGMGLRHEQVWGTDAEKNTLTEYYWEGLPEYIRWEFGGQCVRKYEDQDVISRYYCKPSMVEKTYWEIFYTSAIGRPVDLKIGKMTARELMQLFGTNLMRCMFSDRIWVNSLFRAVERDNPSVAIIPDMRFPSEFAPIYERGGFIIRLTRDVSNGDQHPSEIALDSWCWSQYDRVLVVPADVTIDSCRDLSISWLKKQMDLRTK